MDSIYRLSRKPGFDDAQIVEKTRSGGMARRLRQWRGMTHTTTTTINLSTIIATFTAAAVATIGAFGACDPVVAFARSYLGLVFALRGVEDLRVVARVVEPLRAAVREIDPLVQLDGTRGAIPPEPRTLRALSALLFDVADGFRSASLGFEDRRRFVDSLKGRLELDRLVEVCDRARFACLDASAAVEREHEAAMDLFRSVEHGGDYRVSVPCVESGSGRRRDVVVDPSLVDPRELLIMSTPVRVRSLDEIGVIGAVAAHRVARESAGVSCVAEWRDVEAWYRDAEREAA